MRFAYKLTHKRMVNMDKKTEEKVYTTKLLGFFSTKNMCKEAKQNYIKQPGFKEYPNDFYIEQVEADVDDFNDVSGFFENHVYYLSHEWYDEEYDYISSLGYYSSYQMAEAALKKYSSFPEYINHQEGFCIDDYKIDERQWAEGFFSFR